MARITSYSLDQTLTSGDKVVGTDATTGTVRNYTVGELSTFINTASLGNYSFDTTQTPGAGTDNFVLTYDNSTGKISLEVAASQAAFNIIEDLTPQLGGTLDANSQIIDMGANTITDTKVGQWDTAYGWGDHSSASYLTSETSHTDVLVDGDFGTAGLMTTNGSGTYSITTNNSSNWDTAYGWGDHSAQGYITSETSHADVVVDGDFTSQGIMLRGASSGTYSILTDNSTNWNTAYGWGDHSTQGYVTTSGVTSVTGTAPVVSSGGTTPDISMAAATTSVNGYLTSTDWTTFNNKLTSVSGDPVPTLSGDLDVNNNGIVSSGGNISITPDASGNVVLDGISYPKVDGTIDQVLKTNGAGQLSFTTVGGGVTSVTGTTPVVSSGGTTPDISMAAATTLEGGYLTRIDWNTFNNKLTTVSGDLTPVLSGNLDVNNNSIVSNGGLDIKITPDATGNVIIDGIKYPQADGTGGQVLQTNGAGQLSFVTVSGSGTVTEVTANAPLSVISGASTPDLTITQATTSVDGYLTSTDWNTFNNKLSSVGGDAAPILSGNLDVNGNSIVSGAGGNISITPDTTGSVILDGISYPQADGTIDQVLKTNGAGQLSFTSQTSGTVTSVGGTGTVSGLTLTGTVTSSGNLTLGGSITGFLPLAGGDMEGAITGNQDITGKRPIVTDTTTNIDLTLGIHEGTFIYSDSALAVTVNILLNTAQAFPVGTEIDLIQAGLGQVTITPAGSVNLNGANAGIPITAQWGGVTLKQITVDNWIIVGKI